MNQQACTLYGLYRYIISENFEFVRQQIQEYSRKSSSSEYFGTYSIYKMSSSTNNSYKIPENFIFTLVSGLFLYKTLTFETDLILSTILQTCWDGDFTSWVLSSSIGS